MALKITQNVLSADLLKSLYVYTRDGRQPSRTNFFGWKEIVVGTSSAIFSFKIEDALKKQVAQELIEKGIFEKEPQEWTANIHLMSRGAFIPWHDDANHKASCTIYLNSQWDHNWGGYFLYEERGVTKALTPTYNMGVSFVAPLLHTCTLTAINAPLRESLQIFVDKE
jgi:hypothetical protein